MQNKLTLRLNDDVIKRAKKYASYHKVSLSKIIETYLDNITKQTEVNNKNAITPLVKSLSGVIDLPSDFDNKNAYKNYLTDKYK